MVKEKKKEKKKSEHPSESTIAKLSDESTKDRMIESEFNSKFQTTDGDVDSELFFDLFGNDIRRKILLKLAKFPRYASDLAVDLGVSKQATKKHLDKLMEYGLIEIAEKSRKYSKKQFYQISTDIALFLNISLTPNYFEVVAINKPEELIKGIRDMGHNPETAIISAAYVTDPNSKKEPNSDGNIDFNTDYEQLEYSLKSLGRQLGDVEKEIRHLEEKRRAAILKKTILINRIQMIINALMENDLEKEVINSFFFDINSSIKGLTLNDIVNELFLRKKRRAGVSKYQDYKPDQKTIERGQDLLNLLKILVKNIDFIRIDGKTLFFDFGDE